MDNKKVIKVSFVCTVIAIVISTVAFANIGKNETRANNDSIIRLHVIANSDSNEDQEMKRAVRDKILDLMKTDVPYYESVNLTRDIINSKTEEIKTIALDVVKNYKKDYKVEVMEGTYPFPVKAYGDIVLPAGDYEALKVVIGKGEGQNWWCVLFPPLCFIDATHGAVEPATRDKLQKALPPDQYSIITSVEDEKDVPVKVKFKAVEIFNDIADGIKSWFH